MSSLGIVEETRHDRSQGSAWEWRLAALMAMAAAGFGAYGLWIYELAHGNRVDPASVGYHTLQLFVLHGPHLEPPVPWQLNLGRWLAALVVVGSVGLLAVFRSHCRLYWARFRRGHVVICGLGRLGLQLAQEFRRSGVRVVAIESSGAPGPIGTARDAGVAVITGDACSPANLRRAAVDRASKIIAVCDDEQKNVAIAATIGEMLAPGTNGRRQQESPDAAGPECLLFVADPRLREMFRQDQLFPNTGSHYRVNVHGIDLFELAARQVLRRVPLDYERIQPADQTVVHLVVIGLGPMGQHLAIQAAKIGHFANFQKLQVTVIEQRGSTRPAEFFALYPKFGDVCGFTFTPIDLSSGESPDIEAIVRALPVGASGKTLVTVAVCWDNPRKRSGDAGELLKGLESDDPTNLSIALALNRTHAAGRQVLVFQTRKAGFGALFPMEGRGQAIGTDMHPFGMLEETWSLDALLHEREDRIAKALHEDYYDHQIGAGRRLGQRPALYPWDRLHERFRDSNRRAADHIRVKMRAIGYRIDEPRSDQPSIESFDIAQTELLARMEHESWCAEWLLQGYSYAPGERNDDAKTQPYLVPWDKLDDSVKKYDFDQVSAIPKALERAKYRIYKQVQ